ncbi:DUF3857 domain-containing protein [Winogradskyella sp.]
MSLKCLKFILWGMCFFASFYSFTQDASTYLSLTVSDSLRKNANAIVRYETIDVEVLSIEEIKVKTKRVTTVLNKYGDRHINAGQYYDDNTKIEEISAFVYDEFGNNIKKYKQRDFKDVSAVNEISIYTDDRIKYLEYTPLKYPYTLEYYSEVIFRNTAFFPKWQPIDGYYLSVEHSEFKIKNTSGIELKTKELNFEDYSIEKLDEYHYIASNIGGIKHESYAPLLSDIVPSLKVALVNFNMLGVPGVNNNWSDFGKWIYDGLISGTTDIPEETINEVKLLTDGVEDDIERAKLVYEYMQNKTRYISIQIGIGGWKPMMARDVDELGYSDCKGLTNYTKSLLEAVGVKSYYTLVYGGRTIKDIDKDFSVTQGNHAILCVPTPEENIFLECTSQSSPFGLIAGFTDDRDVLLVKPEGGEIVHTKIYDADDSMQKTEANVLLSEDGGFSAIVTIETTGYQYKLHEGLQNEALRDQELHYKEYWDNINDLTIDDIKLINDKEEIVYTEKVSLTSSNYASKSGSRLIFEPNMFTRSTNIPTRYKNRRLDFKIDRSFKDTDELVITIPEEYGIEAMTASKSIESKFGNYNFKVEKIDGNKIKYTRTYVLLKGDYNKEDYKEFRSFKKQIARLDKNKIVLIKQ